MPVIGERLSPFVPSPPALVDAMLKLARTGPRDALYDLGSGDGQIVIAAARQFGARAVGIEIDDDLVARSSARLAESGVGPRAQILHGDFLHSDLRAATVVTLYQLPAVNELLRSVFEAKLRPGARVVSLDFPIPGWRAARVATSTLVDGSQHAVHLYIVGQTGEVAVALQQSFAPERFAIELDGSNVGVVKSAEGGTASADVVTEKVGPDGIVHKHIGGVKYEDITITCGSGMSKLFYTWIGDVLDGKQSRKDGAVLGADYNSHVVSQLNFFHALVSEVIFPGTDAAAKESASIAVTLSPEYTQFNTGKGSQLASTAPKTSQQFMPGNFRLQIDGLDCTRVNKIDPITVRQAFVEDAVGEARAYTHAPSYVDVSNLAVTIAELGSESFQDWLTDFVIKGNNVAAAEKTGSLEYLGPDLKQVLFTLTFRGLGIFKATPVSAATGTQTVRRVRAEMYCEQLSFTPGAAATGSVSAPPQQTAAVPAALASALADKWAVAGVAVAPQVAAAPVAALRGPGLRFRS